MRRVPPGGSPRGRNSCLLARAADAALPESSSRAVDIATAGTCGGGACFSALDDRCTLALGERGEYAKHKTPFAVEGQIDAP